jgi:glucose/arabinose dehydrogenase
MRSIVAKLFIGMAITAIGMFGADSLLGTWKYNAAKSKTTSTSTNPIKGLTTVLEATPDGGVKMTRTGQLADGTPVSYSFTFKYDGKEYPVTGAPFDTISAKRIDANTTTFETRKTGGKYHSTGRTVISKDGKTLTQTSKGTDAEGKSVASTVVADKQ